MIELTDDLGRLVTIPAPAARIVCLVPSITETLFAVGAGGRVVGITNYCIHPEAEIRSKAKVGGTKNFHVDRVVALEPDLIIANAEENRRHQVDSLEKSGVPVFVTFPKTVDGCLKMISDVATLTGAVRAAQPILDGIRAARADALHRTTRPPARVLCPIWKDPYMTVNADTFVDSVIRNSGGENIFSDAQERYPKFNLEEAAARRPDIVILPTEPYHFTEVDKRPFWDTGCRSIHIVEGELLSWYGPRLARALRELSALLR